MCWREAQQNCDWISMKLWSECVWNFSPVELLVSQRERYPVSQQYREDVRTFARVCSAMHIITQAGVDSTHLSLTSLLSFSRPLQKAGSALSPACSHLDNGQRRNLIVTYELLIFCKATSLLYLRCLQPFTTRSPKEVTCSQQV